MDITDTIAPRSDQLNADDLLAGPATVTVERVDIRNSPEQPAHIHLVEFPGRPYKPSKTMRRLLAVAWGKSANGAYEGRRMTLFRNPETRFGGEVTGGIEISHLSHIDRPVSASLTSTKGKKKTHTVAPLVEQRAPQRPPADPANDPSADEIAACTDLDVLKKWWYEATPTTREQINSRVTELKAATS